MGKWMLVLTEKMMSNKDISWVWWEVGPEKACQGSIIWREWSVGTVDETGLIWAGVHVTCLFLKKVGVFPCKQTRPCAVLLAVLYSTL